MPWRAFCPIGNVIPEPEAVRVICPAWQLKSNPPMAVTPQLQPGNHAKLTGTDVLSQVERDYVSPTAFVHIFTQIFPLCRL